MKNLKSDFLKSKDHDTLYFDGYKEPKSKLNKK